MITINRAVVEQALEAICSAKLCEFNSMSSRREMVRLMDEAITALRAALAQQAEPVEPVDVGLLEYRGNSVAFIHQKMTAYRTGIDAAWDALRANGLHPDGKTPLADMIAKYTAPPQRKPLTDEEIEACRQQGYAHGGLSAPFDFGKAARAVERAHGIGDNT